MVAEGPGCCALLRHVAKVEPFLAPALTWAAQIACHLFSAQTLLAIHSPAAARGPKHSVHLHATSCPSPQWSAYIKKVVL